MNSLQTADTKHVRISCKDLCKSYGAVPVLKDVSLDIAEGEVVALVGPSGSGKTTLCRVLAGLDSADQGRIFMGSELVKEFYGQTGVGIHVNWSDLRLKIGMVFQRYSLFPHMSLLNNVALGPRVVRKLSRAEAIKSAEEALERVGLSHKHQSYPSQLSGGQLQRGAIARELAMKRDLLFFDEPTSALDPELVTEVLAVMASLAKTGMTMIVVTHELQFAKDVADKIGFMNNGILEQYGVAEEVFSSKDPRLARFLATMNHS